MAVLIIVDTPGMTQQDYDAFAGDFDLPEGCTAHFAGPGPEGAWRVATVWDTPDKAKSFMQETLAPEFARLGVTPNPPVISQVHRARVAA
jgi:hypothetical protein